MDFALCRYTDGSKEKKIGMEKCSEIAIRTCFHVGSASLFFGSGLTVGSESPCSLTVRSGFGSGQF